MSRLVAVLATVACMIGFTAAPAPPAVAGTTTVGDSAWSVSLTFPDMQWTSESCQFVPVTAVVTGSGVESWTFGGFVTFRDSEGEGYSWYIDYDTKVSEGSGTFTFRHAVLLCPGYDGSGAYDVVGEVGALLTGTTTWSWLPFRESFTVTGIPTTTTLDPIAMSGPEAIFSGMTAAVAPVPAAFRGCRYGGVEIQVLNAGNWEWVGYAELGESGSFATSVPTYMLTGSQYRASFDGGSICATSVSEVRELPVRLPVVHLSAAGKQSKLKVDIDPNKGRRAWVFEVQRQQDDEWRTLRTYRTRGSKETRTINLPKGLYRVHVKARFGYAETYSDTLYLER